MLSGLLETIEHLKGALHNPECLYCRINLASPYQQPSLFCDRCLNILGMREPFPIAHTGNFQIHAATLFNPQIKQVLYGYKFYGHRGASKTLTELMIHYWQHQDGVQAIPAASTLVTPVPPHSRKAYHTHALAERFARHFGYRFDADLLKWQRRVLPQRTLTGKRRRFANIRGSLGAVAERIFQSPPERIIIVDDITTTGATLYESARAFYRTKQVDARQTQVVGFAVSSIPLAIQRSKVTGCSGYPNFVS